MWVDYSNHLPSFGRYFVNHVLRVRELMWIPCEVPKYLNFASSIKTAGETRNLVRWFLCGDWLRNVLVCLIRLQGTFLKILNSNSWGKRRWTIIHRRNQPITTGSHPQQLILPGQQKPLYCFPFLSLMKRSRFLHSVYIKYPSSSLICGSMLHTIFLPLEATLFSISSGFGNRSWLNVKYLVKE